MQCTWVTVFSSDKTFFTLTFSHMTKKRSLCPEAGACASRTADEDGEGGLGGASTR